MFGACTAVLCQGRRLMAEADLWGLAGGKAGFAVEYAITEHWSAGGAVGLGFSHFGTAFSIVLLNLVNVLVWWISFRLGASVNLQLLVVIFMGLWNTFCIYKIVYWNKKYDTNLYHILLKVGEITHVERTGVWGKLRRMLDQMTND